MKKLFVLALALMGIMQVSGQNKDNVRRSSLYTIKLDVPDSNPEHAEALKIMNEVYDQLVVPDCYNDFSLAVNHIAVGNLPEASSEEIDQYKKKGAGAAKFLKSAAGDIAPTLAAGPSISNEEYIARLMNYFTENKVANGLVAKWHSKPGTPAGTYDLDTELQVLTEKGLMGLSEDQKAQIEKGALVSTVQEKYADDVIGNSYVVVNRYSFLSGKELFEELSAPIVAQLASANPLVAVGLNATLEAMKKKFATGYFVRCHAYLFKLVYEPGAEADFLTNYWNTPDAFANANYRLEYVGKSDGRARARKATDGNVLAVAMQRATDKCYADLQHDNEQFRPFAALHEIDGQLGAYIGTKEGVTEKTAFNVYITEMDKNGKFSDKKVGSLKVEKDGVWDNRARTGLDEENADDDDEKVSGDASRTFTLFKGKPGKLGEGCFIKAAK